MADIERDRAWMRVALDAATRSPHEVPVGAVLVDWRNQLIATASNGQTQKSDPTAHAEIEVLRSSSRTGPKVSSRRTIYVTLEPCIMCASAIRYARIHRVVYAATEPRLGAGGSAFDILRDSRLGPVPEVVSGVLAEEAAQVLVSFFQNLREGEDRR